MPQFRVTAPDGTAYNVTAPDGATEQDALAQVQAQHQDASQSDAPGVSNWTNIGAENTQQASRPADYNAPPPLTPGNAAGMAGDLGLGLLNGALGSFGDLEHLARISSRRGGAVSQENTLPTSDDINSGNSALSFAGAPQTHDNAVMRDLGSFLSPLAMMRGIPMLARGAVAVAKPIVSNTLGVTTGAGPKAIEGAYDAGKAGGAAGDAFLDNMRGQVPITDVVQAAKDAVEQMGQDRSAAYRAGIGSTIKGDPAILDMQPVHDAVAKALNVGTFKGVTLSQSAQKVRDAIQSVLTDWQSLDPAQYHTAEGLDALKQKIGNLAYEGELSTAAAPGTPGSKILGNVYNAIKGQIVQQAPGYAQVMKDYSEASDELRAIQSALSLNPKANVDTSLRKLQSIMRNNANTNYGARTAMAQSLVDNGASDLIPALSGQALSSPTPRGIAAAGDIGAIGGAALAGHPGGLLALPFASPRLVGEGAYALGSLSRKAGAVLPNAGQAAPAIGNSAVMSIANNPVLRALLLNAQLSRAIVPNGAQK